MRLAHWILVMAAPFALASMNSCSRAAAPSGSTPTTEVAGGVPAAPARAQSQPPAGEPQTPVAAAAAAAQAGAVVPLIGEPRSFDNLTVFPITSKAQVDVGPM